MRTFLVIRSGRSETQRREKTGERSGKGEEETKCKFLSLEVSLLGGTAMDCRSTKPHKKIRGRGGEIDRLRTRERGKVPPQVMGDC